MLGNVRPEQCARRASLVASSRYAYAWCSIEEGAWLAAPVRRTLGGCLIGPIEGMMERGSGG
jgi:hypothetical protein